MNDDMIKTLADNGGVIQINFGSSFLTEESRDKSTANREKIVAYAEENGLTQEDDELMEYARKVQGENPSYADVTDVADHIDHVVKIAGIATLPSALTMTASATAFLTDSRTSLSFPISSSIC